MFSARTATGKGLKTGYSRLDKIINIDEGIVTLRSASWEWLFHLAANLLVRNHSEQKKTLYLHWVDYHNRYWTLDYDAIAAIAKEQSVDLDSIL